MYLIMAAWQFTLGMDMKATEILQDDYSLFDHVTSWFDRQGMNYDAHPERSYIASCVLRKDGRWGLVIEIDEQYRQIFFYSQLDMFSPEDRFQAVMEFMTRANHGMRQGHFELDLTDGEMCFKIGIQFSELAPSDMQVGSLINCVIGVTSQYFPGLMAVIYGGCKPKEAVESIEVPPRRLASQPLH